MIVQSFHLVLEICHGKIDLIRLIDTAHIVNLRDAAITLPFPLTAPADKGKQTITVAQVIDCIVLAPDIFEADAIHIHIHHVLQLPVNAFVSIAEENVVSPARSLEQYVLAIESELPVTLFIESRRNLTYAESHFLVVRYPAFSLHSHIQSIEFRSSQVITPPHARLVHVKVRRLLRCKADHPFFPSLKFNRNAAYSGILQVNQDFSALRSIGSIFQADSQFEICIRK